MSTNKHAVIRYDTLDRCFSNFCRRYYIEDLIEACNRALYSYSGIEECVHRHQIYNDILFMLDHWNIPLEKLKDGKRTFFRYSDRSYSIRQSILKENEITQIESALSLLRCFDGIPNFEWVSEIDAHFRTTFQLKESEGRHVVEFQHNPFLHGLNFFSTLFNAIENKNVMEIHYQSFGKAEKTFIVHPYYLKQYSDRWYLLSLNEEKLLIINLALDRMVSVKVLNKPYIDNTSVDFNDYYYDAIGITVPEKKDVMAIRLKVAAKQMPYVFTRPIHGSQRIISQEADYSIVELKVYDTYELRSVILSFGRNVEVLSPDKVRQEIADIVRSMNEQYIS